MNEHLGWEDPSPAYREGQAAYERGMTLDDNPFGHLVEAGEHLDWEEGWYAAEAAEEER